MLSAPAPRPPSADHSFFSNARSSSKGASSSSCPPPAVVTRPPVAPIQPSTSKLPSLPPSSPPASSGRSSPFSESDIPLRKRKSLQNDPTVGPPDLVPRDVKRLRTASAKPKKPRKSKSSASSKASSRGSSRPADLLPPSPEPLYRISRSRSTSSFPLTSPDLPIFKRKWRTDEDGLPGPTFLSSETVVQGLIKSYKSYFQNPQDPNDRSFEIDPQNSPGYPVVYLEYPNTNASERYILLAPKDKDHYNPIMDLESSLYTIVEFYCTKEQQALFGPIPSDTLSETISFTSLSQSPSPSPPFSSPSPSSSPCQPSVTNSEFSVGNRPQALLRTFKRALNRQDGPTFVTTLNEINSLLRSFKYPNPDHPLAESNSLMQAPLQWTDPGFPHKVMMRIIEENYQRTVGPKVRSLRQYEAFSSTVYGELMPNLIDEIVRITDLREGSLFIDLGSGVGNVVAQASLQAGCTSFGVELMEAPSIIANNTLEQIKIRSRMWGLDIGEMEVERGDMLKSKRVTELIPKADVVLVDNKVFEESLNEALRPRFLDLKEGAIVVSLAPFANTSNTRVTARNLDDMSAIFEVTEREYHSGSVSWGNGGGSYYLHRVDRAGYATIKHEFENRMSRSSRRRH